MRECKTRWTVRAGLLHTLDAKKKKRKRGGGREKSHQHTHTHTHTQKKKEDEEMKNEKNEEKKVEKERSLPVTVDSQTFWHFTMQFHYNKPWDSLNLLAQSLCLNGPIPTQSAD